MKKLLSLLLCLALLLPAMAFAETETVPELYTIDFGYFTMDLGANDYYQVAAERQNNTAYALIYPNYDAANPSPTNINVVWGADDFSLQVKLFGADLYTQSILMSTKNTYESMGYTLNNPQVLTATIEDGLFSTKFCYDLSVSGTTDVTPIYQLQNYYFFGDAGCYVFTLTSNSLEELESLTYYFDHIVFK